MARYLLLTARILLGAFSILMLSLQLLGMAFVAQTVRGLFRVDLWADFHYGFGLLFSMFCIATCLGLLRANILLTAGIVMQVLAVFSLLFGGIGGIADSARYGFYLFAVYTVLWWFHFFSLHAHTKSMNFEPT